MRNRIIYIFIIISTVFLGSCTTASYLPTGISFPKTVHGSMIKITCNQITLLNKDLIKSSKSKNTIIKEFDMKIDGEMIAADSLGIYILTNNIDYPFVGVGQNNPYQLVKVNFNSINKYQVFYADLGPFLLLIPLNYISPFFGNHETIGFLLYSNYYLGIWQYNNSFNYTMNELSINKLFIFCRYPQGLPHSIDFEKFR